MAPPSPARFTFWVAAGVATCTWGITGTRAQAGNTIEVATGADLQQALLNRAQHILVIGHLDMQGLPAQACNSSTDVNVAETFEFGLDALLCATAPTAGPGTELSIRGDCPSTPSPSATGPELPALRAHQCVIRVDRPWLLVRSWDVWLHNLHVVLVARAESVISPKFRLLDLSDKARVWSTDVGLQGDGGDVHLVWLWDRQTKLLMFESLLADCSGREGPAMHSRGSSAVMSSAVIRANVSDAPTGGAIHVPEGHLLCSGCSFDEGSVPPLSASRPDSVFLDDKEMTVVYAFTSPVTVGPGLPIGEAVEGFLSLNDQTFESIREEAQTLLPSSRFARWEPPAQAPPLVPDLGQPGQASVATPLPAPQGPSSSTRLPLIIGVAVAASGGVAILLVLMYHAYRKKSRGPGGLYAAGLGDGRDDHGALSLGQQVVVQHPHDAFRYGYENVKPTEAERKAARIVDVPLPPMSSGTGTSTVQIGTTPEQAAVQAAARCAGQSPGGGWYRGPSASPHGMQSIATAAPFGSGTAFPEHVGVPEALPWPSSGGSVASASCSPHSQIGIMLDQLYLSRELLFGRFKIVGTDSTSRRRGGRAFVQFVKDVHTRQGLAAKFFVRDHDYERERELYQIAALRAAMPPLVLAHEAGWRPTGWSPSFSMLPCLVMERGESMSEFVRAAGNDLFTTMQALGHVARKLGDLHSTGWVHRDLKPANLLWNPKSRSWALLDFGCVARAGARANIAYSAAYAAPEVLAAVENARSDVVVTPAIDMWALGIIAFEMLTEVPVFPPLSRRSDIVAAVLGSSPMPWEDPAVKGPLLKKLGIFRRSILACLHRDPSHRIACPELYTRWTQLFSEQGTTTVHMMG